MGITEKQKEARQKHLGSSDLAAIMNLSPFANPLSVYLSKTQSLEDIKTSEAIRDGNLLEEPILKFLEMTIGKLIRNQYRAKPDYHLGSNVDALVVDTSNPVEAKSSGVKGVVYGDWGEEGTDQIPEHVIIQCHVHMICTDKEIFFFPDFMVLSSEYKSSSYSLAFIHISHLAFIIASRQSGALPSYP